MLMRLRDTVRQMGWGTALVYALDRLSRRLTLGRAGIHCYWICAQPVPTAALLPANRGRNVEVRDVESGSPDIERLPRATSVLQARFAQHGRCLTAHVGPQFAGFLWFNLGGYREDEVRCDYRWSPPGACAWDYDVFVAPQFRGSLVFARLWDEANRRFRELGVHWSLSRISAFKPDSLAAHSRLGIRRLGRVWFIEIGPIQIASSRLGRRLHVSATTAGRYRLALRAPDSND
jgi:hypothetical protein